MLRTPRPSDPRDVQRLAFQTAEDLLSKLRHDRSYRRLRVYVVPTEECTEAVLKDWFLDGYDQTVAPAWDRYLRAAGLDRFEDLSLVFEILPSPYEAPTEAVRLALDRRAVAVVPERTQDARAVLSLEVADPSWLEDPSRHTVVVTPQRPAYIGRLRTVTDRAGHVVRTNDLAFRRDLQTIGRLQARISFDAGADRYVLTDGVDVKRRSQVLRHGQPVEGSGSLPTPLQNGDAVSLPGGVIVYCSSPPASELGSP